MQLHQVTLLVNVVIKFDITYLTFRCIGSSAIVMNSSSPTSTSMQLQYVCVCYKFYKFNLYANYWLAQKYIPNTHTHIYTGDSFLLQVKRPICLQWLMFAYIFAGSTTVIDHLFCLDNLCVCVGGQTRMETNELMEKRHHKINCIAYHTSYFIDHNRRLFSPC